MKKIRLVFPFLLIIYFTNYSIGQPYEVPIYTITSFQEPQPGQEVLNTINGDINSIYHSRWGQVGMPDTVDVFFTDRVLSISEIIYLPRTSGLNGVWTDVDVYYSTKEEPQVFKSLPENPFSWPANNDAKAIELHVPIENPAVIRFAINSGHGDYSSCAALRFFSDEEILPADDVDCFIPIGDLLDNTIQDEKAEILLEGSFASSFQPGENIERSFDSDINTIYHSSWSTTTFPVTLNYRLNGATDIDYLKYTPRSFGSNGFFGKVEIYYNTEESGPGSDFIHLMDYDFGQSGLTTRVDFPTTIRPLNIRIEVLDGLGDFASCAEMEFYSQNQHSDGDRPYKEIFTDELYAALLPEIDQSSIDTISSNYFKSLAQCLLDNSYTLRYRLQSYEVYTPLSTIRQELKVANYNAFENPTGIVFSEGDTAVLFVKNIPIDVPAYLRIRDFANEEDPKDRAYQLNNGINIIHLENSGLGYISYYDNNLDLPNIEINITTGKVNGYFDVHQSDNEDWQELISNEHYSKLDIIGDYTHLIYDKQALRFGSPFDGKALIQTYDTIVDHERMLMGMYKYPERQVKNRMLSLSGSSGGWYAGGLGIHLDLSWGVNSVTNPNALGLWGIAHEFGHVNQIRPGIRWHGTIEVTTNIYSTWVTYHMNNQNNLYTRLESDVVSPDQVSNPIAGGRINGFLEATQIRKEALKGAENYDVFKVLVPFWQLQLYYQLAGASRNAPILSLDNPTPDFEEVDYANFFGIVAEMVRNSDLNGKTPGELQLNYVKMVCDAVEEDLTDFFINAGFLRPINTIIDDYGELPFIITQAQVDETIEYIKSKGYRQPVSPVIHYISAHSLSSFKDQKNIEGTTGEGVMITEDNALTIDHAVWKNVIAYETYDVEGQLKHIAITGTGDPSNQSTIVTANPDRDTIYAIGFDGEKKQVYPELALSSQAGQLNRLPLIVYPNPLTDDDVLGIVIDDDEGEFKLSLSGQNGILLLTVQGDLITVINRVNQTVAYSPPGAYVLQLIDRHNNIYSAKIIKQ